MSTKFSLPDEPNLEKALNDFAKAIDAKVDKHKSRRFATDGVDFTIDQNEDAVTFKKARNPYDHRPKPPPWLPIIVGSKYVGQGVGVVPGYVVWQKPFTGNSHDGNSLSESAMPTIGGVRLDWVVTPYFEVLVKGDYSIYCQTIRHAAEMVMVKKGDVPESRIGFQQTLVADVSVDFDEAGDLFMVDYVHHVEAPYFIWVQHCASYEVIAWMEERDVDEEEVVSLNGRAEEVFAVPKKKTVYKALMQGGIYMDHGTGDSDAAKTTFHGAKIDSFLSKPVEVEAGDMFIANWNTNENGVLIPYYGVWVEKKKVKGESIPFIPPRAITCEDLGQTGHYEMIVAEFVAVEKDPLAPPAEETKGLYVKQHHTGTIWLCVDRTGVPCDDGSGDSSSDSGSSSDSLGSSKDTAIVGTSQGYKKWYAMESAEVVFFDFIECAVPRGVSRVAIDPIVLEGIEKGTIRAFISPERGSARVRVVDGQLVIHARHWLWPNLQTVQIMLYGTRKGFRGVRNATATFEQFVDNECRLNPHLTREQVFDRLTIASK